MARTIHDEEWTRYGRSMIEAMSDVLEEVDDRHRGVLLETADFWLSLGLILGLERPEEARRVVDVLLSQGGDRAELLSDAEDFLAAIR
jgi:hypothetical protein